MSAKPAVALKELSVGHPIQKYGTAERFVAITDLYLEQTPPPKTRAATLQRADEADGVFHSALPQIDSAARAWRSSPPAA